MHFYWASYPTQPSPVEEIDVLDDSKTSVGIVPKLIRIEIGKLYLWDIRRNPSESLRLRYKNIRHSRPARRNIVVWWACRSRSSGTLLGSSTPTPENCTHASPLCSLLPFSLEVPLYIRLKLFNPNCLQHREFFKVQISSQIRRIFRFGSTTVCASLIAVHKQTCGP